jgi:hypothetical protein
MRHGQACGKAPWPSDQDAATCTSDVDRLYGPVRTPSAMWTHAQALACRECRAGPRAAPAERSLNGAGAAANEVPCRREARAFQPRWVPSTRPSRKRALSSSRALRAPLARRGVCCRLRRSTGECARSSQEELAAQAALCCLQHRGASKMERRICRAVFQSSNPCRRRPIGCSPGPRVNQLTGCYSPAHRPSWIRRAVGQDR